MNKMKIAIKLLAIGFIAMSFTDAQAHNRRERGYYIEYWQRSSYNEGFVDGYDGINRRKYCDELDSIAYDIGYIDGWQAFENENRNCRKKF